MTPAQTPSDVQRLAAERLVNQRLVGSDLASPAEVVRWLGAVQAQDYYGAKWAIAQRTRGFQAISETDSPATDGAATGPNLRRGSRSSRSAKPLPPGVTVDAPVSTRVNDAAIDRAFDAGEIIRTHVLRPTWHFVAPEDLRWLLALTGPRIHAQNSHLGRRLDLDEATLFRGHEILRRGLEGGISLTREEIADLLVRNGIAASGLRLIYMVMNAELSGVICSGPRRGKRFTYALLDERVAPSPVPSRDEALAGLTRRYFLSHGPATVYDFAWWSGLTVGDARRGIESVRSGLVLQKVRETEYWTGGDSNGSSGSIGNSERSPAVAGFGGSSATDEKPIFHLLPNFDELTVAYRDRSPSIAPGAAWRVTSTAVLGNSVASNGHVVGSWRRILSSSSVDVFIDMAIPLRRGMNAALERSARQFGEFLGLPLKIGIG